MQSFRGKRNGRSAESGVNPDLRRDHWKWPLQEMAILAFALLVAFSTQVSVAGPLLDYYKLEEQMADAQEGFLKTGEGEAPAEPVETEKGAKATSAASSDKRLDILKRMDLLTAAAGGKPDGAEIAIGTFFWSWNLDLDLDRLHNRFEWIATQYPNDPGLDDVLFHAVDVAEATEKADAWARLLKQLSKTATRKQTKLQALLALGQLEISTKKLGKARSALEALLKLDPKKELVDSAKGYLYEIDHLQIGMVAPDFVTKTLDGKEVSLKSLAGKVILLNFWASW